MNTDIHNSLCFLAYGLKAELVLRRLLLGGSRRILSLPTYYNYQQTFYCSPEIVQSSQLCYNPYDCKQQLTTTSFRTSVAECCYTSQLAGFSSHPNTTNFLENFSKFLRNFSQSSWVRSSMQTSLGL